MSKVKLTGESSGYVEISAGTAAGNNTLELPTSGNKIISNNYVGVVTATTFSGDVTVATGATISGSTDTIIASTNGSERVRISSDGTFYLGGYLEATTNNNTVKKIAVAPYNWTGGSTAEIASIEMGAPGTGSDDGNIIFKTATNVDSGGTLNEAMKIQYDGNVGIGTDNPSKPLQVHSDSLSAVLVTGYTPQIRFNSSAGDGTDADRVILGRATGNDQFITGSVDGDAILRCATSKKVMIGYGTTEIAQFNSSGLKFKTSGMGIDFSATSDASGMTSELLDDYEEGTWTPVWTQTGGFTLGNGTLEGTYTKIGRLVYITMRFEMGSTTSLGTGYVHSISGLPFTIQTNTNTFLVTASNASNNWIGWSSNYASNTSGLNYIQFVRSGNVQDGMYDTSPFTWTTGDDLRMSGSYFTAQ